MTTAHAVVSNVECTTKTISVCDLHVYRLRGRGSYRREQCATHGSTISKQKKTSESAFSLEHSSSVQEEISQGSEYSEASK